MTPATNNGKTLPDAIVATTVGSRELRTDTAEYLGRTYFAGERFLLTRNGRRMAAMVTVEDLAALGITIADDMPELEAVKVPA